MAFQAAGRIHYGIRLASDERILGSSEFVEASLKHAGEVYERRMRMQSAGIDLSAVIAAACRYLGIEEKELARPTRRVEIAGASASDQLCCNADLVDLRKRSGSPV